MPTFKLLVLYKALPKFYLLIIIVIYGLWVVVGLVFTIIGIIIFNYRIQQLYPWLNIDLKKGRKNLKKYPEVLKKTRQILFRKSKISFSIAVTRSWWACLSLSSRLPSMAIIP